MRKWLSRLATFKYGDYLMQPVHITTKAVSSNPTLGGFLHEGPISVLLKVALNTISLTPYLNYKKVTSSEKIIIFQSPYLNVAKRDNH
jgi:hypothetical protein